MGSDTVMAAVVWIFPINAGTWLGLGVMVSGMIAGYLFFVRPILSRRDRDDVDGHD